MVKSHSCSMDASMHNLCCMKQTTCYIPRNPGWRMVILWDIHDGFLLIPTYLCSFWKSALPREALGNHTEGIRDHSPLTTDTPFELVGPESAWMII